MKANYVSGTYMYMRSRIVLNHAKYISVFRIPECNVPNTRFYFYHLILSNHFFLAKTLIENRIFDLAQTYE